MMTDQVDESGRTPLHYAALNGDQEEIERLVSSGADPNASDQQGFTPLHLAAQEGFLEAARILLDHGADPNQPNAYGNAPLFTAVYNSRGKGEIISLLRARGADPYHVNDAGQTPVGLARLIGNFDVAQFFGDLG